MAAPVTVSGNSIPARRRLWRSALANVYDAFTLPAENARYRALDGTRAVAVVLVYFVHFYAVFKPWMPGSGASSGIALILSNFGNAGVDIFFGISGILIYRHLLLSKVAYAAFLRRRAVRIYPTFLAVFGLYLLLSVVFKGESKLPERLPDTLGYIAANLLLLPGIFEIRPIITVAWSLSYEFAFYLLLPPLMSSLALRGLSNRRRIAILSVITVLVLAIEYVAPLAHARMLYFVGGMIAYEVSEILVIRRIASSRLWLVLWPTLALLLVAMGAGVIRGWTFLVLSLTTYSAFLAAALVDSCPVARSLMWRPLRGVGMISYSYYLIHGLTLKALALGFGLIIPMSALSPTYYWMLLILALVITFAVASALYFLVEWRFSLRKPRSR